MNAVRSIKRWLGSAWFNLFRWTGGPSQRSGGDDVVLVRADGIGDLLYSLPLVEAIRRSTPRGRTTLVCDAGATDLVRLLDVADDVMPFDRTRYRRDPRYRWQVWKQLRSIGASRAVDLQYHRSPTSNELLIATGAIRTVSMSGNDEMITDDERRAFDGMIETIVDVPDHVPERTRYERLSNACGWREADWDRAYGRVLLERADIGAPVRSESGSVIALAPGGSSAMRRWPVERWIELTRRLSEQEGIRPVLVGGAMDRTWLETIAAALDRNVSVRTGRDVLELARILLSSDVTVGIDAGISHLAARMGVPVVVILGGGHFSRYFPYGTASICYARQECYECNWRCHRDAVHCVTDIGADVVFAETIRRLSESRGSGRE